MAAPAAAPAAVPPGGKPPAPPAGAPAGAPPAAAPPAGAPPAGAPAAKPPAGPPGGPPKPAGAAQPVVFAANKPDEPAFQLKLDPENRLLFKGDRMFEGTTTIDVKLTNTSKARQTFKVKCTSNDMFRVRPPLGFCEPGETAIIKIIFACKVIPQSARHFFAFYHMKSDEKEKTARQVWTPQSKPEGVRRVLVFFEKNDGTPAATPPPPPPGAPAPGAPPAAGKPPAPGAPPPGGQPPSNPPGNHNGEEHDINKPLDDGVQKHPYLDLDSVSPPSTASLRRI
ncbi:Uncharacterized protein R05D3.5 [Toxocara canis]|uniref:Major sperm protein n=1 Tax=Toxocara canis TaxID=6265 RepID=A0A0B2VUL5_TOXCA|nr:Uncharacterized protein R05D3.5 [Toxocara canis]